MTTPDLRVTIRRDGLVRAIPWTPWLQVCGPTATLLDARGRAGVTIADLTIVREEPDAPDEAAAGGGGDEDFPWEVETPAPIAELFVDPLAGDVEGPAAQALLDWAALVGYRRVWLPDGVVELTPATPTRMHVRCTACRGRLVDGTDAFWDFAHTRGHFPAACPLCGGDLPQWTPVRPRRPRGASARPATLSKEIADVRVSDLRDQGRL